MWQMHDGMGWWMVIGSMWFLAFWGVIIWALVQATTRSGPRIEAGDSAIEILRRRYARGEITREQFDEMRRHLDG